MKERKVVIRGQGGGSSSGSGSVREPVVAPDSIKSKAILAILDLLGEGQIKGLVNGQESIFINGTSLANEDGSKNFSGFTVDFRDGKQVQDPVSGFPSVSTPFNVGVQIKNGTPYTFTVSDSDADYVNVIINIPALSTQNSTTGDVSAAKVEYQFTMSVNGGPFNPVNLAGTTSGLITINDKSRSKYQRQHNIPLPKPGSNYRIRITRITDDSTSTTLQNDTYIDSYYEVLDNQLTYPNSVVCGFKIDAEQFNDMPERSYLVDGLYVQIPSNYNPETRVYTGVWDGSFKIGYTNNPAWILRDLLLNKRYGLGEFINASQINSAKLYSIARYCDGMVTDGMGGEEPRFTINTVIAAQRDAYKVVQDICSVFRGMSYWANGAVQVTQDSPADPQYLFTNANVVDGLFNRVGSARKDRHSVVHVTWNDPLDGYKQKIEYVEDKDLINSIGYRKFDTVAFGCTSRAQAHRIGLWILYTESVETNVMTFEVGLEGVQCAPGDIVKIHDQYKAGKRVGGRLKSCTRTGCKLDSTVALVAGSKISIQMPDGKFEEVGFNELGNNDTLTFTTQLSVQPMANAIWMIAQPNLVPQLARCVGVSQSETAGQFVISVVDHNPSKYASIEQGLNLESQPTTILDPTNANPEYLKIEEFTYLVAPGQLGTKLEVSWEGKSPNYYVSWRANSGDGASGWKKERVGVPSFTLLNVLDGTIYDFKVVGISVTGKLSNELVGTYTTLGTKNPPKPPTNLTAAGDFRQVILNWVNSGDVDFDYVQIYENTVDDINTAYYLDRTPSNTYIRSGVPTLMKYYYWVRTVNKRGMVSDWNSTAGTSAIAGVIGRTDLDEQLGQDIDNVLEAVDALDEINQAVDHATTVVNEMETKVDGVFDDIEEALALAQAARSGSAIEEILREEENVNIRQEIYQLGVSVGEDVSAQIEEINTVLTTDREALASQMLAIEAKFQSSDAALVSEQTARASADSAQVTSINSLVAKTDATNAALVSEQTARATADSAQVTSINGLIAKTDTTNAALAAETTARATADSAQVTSINALIAKTDATNAAVTTEQTARANGDSANASAITALTATVGSNDTAVKALITSEANARATADGALSTRVDSAVASSGANAAAITAEQTARTNADNALSTRIDTVTAKANTNAAAITSEQTARANADSALGTRIDTVVATATADKTSLTAAIQAETTARVNADGALSTRIDTAQAGTNAANAAVSTTSTALSALDGKLSASWTAKVQIASNGMTYMAGMGIGIQNTAQGITQSQIAFQADRVVMFNPANGTSVYPFQLIGGIVYLSTTVIQDASITNAKIANATITAAKIGDAQITNAKIANAAITTAKIGSAQVDTLQIAGNAVTVPVSAAASASSVTTGWVEYSHATTVIIQAYGRGSGSNDGQMKTHSFTITAYGADGSTRVIMSSAVGMSVGFTTLGCSYGTTTTLPVGTYRFVLSCTTSGGSFSWASCNLSIIGAMR